MITTMETKDVYNHGKRMYTTMNKSMFTTMKKGCLQPWKKGCLQPWKKGCLQGYRKLGLFNQSFYFQVFFQKLFR